MKQCYKNFLRLSFFVLTLTALSGCPLFQRRNQPPPPAPFLEHQVRYGGETLGLIAQWYTGSLQNWSQIAKANPQLVAHKIKVGDTVRIPRHLVTRETLLPQSAVPKNGKGSPTKTPKPGSGEAVSPVWTPVAEDFEPTPAGTPRQLETFDDLIPPRQAPNLPPLSEPEPTAASTKSVEDILQDKDPIEAATPAPDSSKIRDELFKDLNENY
jgi:hypothetical protein